MKISSTEGYLRLALHTIDEKIVPELASGDSRNAADTLKLVLTNLLKRERSIARLRDDLKYGEALARELQELCDRMAGRNSATSTSEDALLSDGFSDLAEKHYEVTQRISALVNNLAEQRGSQQGIQNKLLISSLLHKAALWEAGFPGELRDLALPDVPVSDTHAGVPLHRALLEEFVQSQHRDGKNCRVTDMQPIAGGFGKQTFRVTLLNGAGAEEKVIARKSDPNPMVKKGCFLIEQEFYLLRDIFNSGVLPVAKPLYLAKDFPGVDADFYVMSALPGSVPSSFLGASSAVIPESILLQMAESMAKLHCIDPASFPEYAARFGHPDLLTDSVESCYQRSIQEWQDYFENNDHLASPFVVYLIDWLKENLPAHKRRPVLVHGDFNIHNILAENGRITGILDWECAMFGAPEQDLAYVKPIVSQHIDWDRFLAHYLESGGPQIDVDSMNFYMTFSAMRLCIVFNKGVQNMQNSVSRDIRYSVVDLHLTPEFMKLALACTAS